MTEEQIVTDLALADELAKRLRPLDVNLAIDDFGRGYSALAGLKECRLRNSSSTALSSTIAAPTGSTRRYAGP